MKSIIEMGSSGMIYMSSLIKAGIGVARIGQFCFNNLKDCNVRFTDGGNL
jgi:hypothetical protein